MSDLVAIAALWRHRAAVAEEAAEELENLGLQVGQTLRRNDLGTGCAEGEALYLKVRGAASVLSRNLTTLAADATNLSQASLSAASSYVESDDASSKGLRVVE